MKQVSCWLLIIVTFLVGCQTKPDYSGPSRGEGPKGLSFAQASALNMGEGDASAEEKSSVDSSASGMAQKDGADADDERSMVFENEDSILVELDITKVKLPIANTDRATVTILNYSRTKPIIMGSSYSIQYLNHGKWTAPKLKETSDGLFAWHANMVVIDPYKGKECWVSFFADDFEYVPGKYRFVYRYRSSHHEAKKELYAEFEVVE